MCVQTYLKERPVLPESTKTGVLMACQNEQVSSEQELNGCPFVPLSLCGSEVRMHCLHCVNAKMCEFVLSDCI